MADPHLRNGYTRIANELLEAICKLNISGSEMRILLYIIRRTYGFNRTSAEMSITEIAEGIGAKRDNISRTLKKLRRANIIEHSSSNGVTPQTVSIVKDYDKWAVEGCAVLLSSKMTTVVKNDNSGVVKNDNSSVVKIDNSSIVKNDNTTYKEINKDIKESEKERTPYGEYSNVFLSAKEHEQLVYDYGDEVAERYINRVSEWIRAKGARVSDHNAMLRHWLDQDSVPLIDHTVDKYKIFINRF